MKRGTGINDEVPGFAAENLNSLELDGVGTWYRYRHDWESSDNKEGAVKLLHKDRLAISPVMKESIYTFCSFIETADFILQAERNIMYLEWNGRMVRDWIKKASKPHVWVSGPCVECDLWESFGIV